MIKKTYSYLLAVLIISSSAFAKDDCLPEKSNRLVNDYVGTLSSEQQKHLETKLVDFSTKTSTQIVVLVVDDLCNYDKAQYTTQVGIKWKIGQKESDNGLVVMVKPTGGPGERQVFIATGYGLEGVIPDAIAKRIVEFEMIPLFKEGDIFGGINAATTVLMQLAEKEFTANEYVASKETPVEGWMAILPFLFFAGFIFLIKISNARRYASRNNLGLWAAMALMSSSSRSGSYSNFSSGGGSFGGFGGGSFGGGGAGGSW